jgi:hypothetical protein
MPYDTTDNLVFDALRRAGEPIDGSSEFQSAALDYLNRGYSGLATGTLEQSEDTHFPWWWLRSPTPGVITLVPNYVDGACQVFLGSTFVNLSVLPKDPIGNFISLQGFNVKFQGGSTASSGMDVFKVAAHLSGQTAVTLDSMYTGPDGVVQGNFFQLEYDTPSDLLYVIAPLRAYQTGKEKINVISQDSMEAMFPLNQINFGIPTDAAFIGEQRFRFSHYVGAGTPTRYVRVDFEYIRLPPILTGAPGEAPLVPINYRSLLADYALQQLYVEKNDDRATAIGSLIKAKINGMRREQMTRMTRASQNMGRVFTRQQDRASIRGPWRTESGLVIGY